MAPKMILVGHLRNTCSKLPSISYICSFKIKLSYQTLSKAFEMFLLHTSTGGLQSKL